MDILDGLDVEIAAALEHHARPRGGQSVTETGDFVRCPVSALRRLQWWMRELRRSLTPQAR